MKPNLRLVTDDDEKEQTGVRWSCTGCGLSADAPCDCGKPIAILRPRERVEAALEKPENRGKANTVLADELGVNERTVRNVRKTKSEKSESVSRPKEPAEPKKPPPAPKTEAASKVIRSKREAGEEPARKQLREEGHGEQSIKLADWFERGRLEGLREAAEAAAKAAVIDESILSKSAQEKFAALERRLRAQVEREMMERVQRESQKNIQEHWMPYHKKRLEQADAILKHRKPFTHDEYRNILRALHKDSTNEDNRLVAFLLIKDKELMLRPDERDKPLSGGLPSTVAEMMAMRKKKP